MEIFKSLLFIKMDSVESDVDGSSKAVKHSLMLFFYLRLLRSLGGQLEALYSIGGSEAENSVRYSPKKCLKIKK